MLFTERKQYLLRKNQRDGVPLTPSVHGDVRNMRTLVVVTNIYVLGVHKFPDRIYSR